MPSMRRSASRAGYRNFRRDSDLSTEFYSDAEEYGGSPTWTGASAAADIGTPRTAASPSHAAPPSPRPADPSRAQSDAGSRVRVPWLPPKENMNSPRQSPKHSPAHSPPASHKPGSGCPPAYSTLGNGDSVGVRSLQPHRSAPYVIAQQRAIEVPSQENLQGRLHKLEDRQWGNDLEHDDEWRTQTTDASSPVHVHAAAMHWKRHWRADFET